MTVIAHMGRPPDAASCLTMRSVFEERIKRTNLHQYMILQLSLPGLASAARCSAVVVVMGLAGATLASAQSAKTADAQPLVTVPRVDWSQYVGKWYELARLPNSFQRKCVADVIAEYTALPSGSIRVVNRCQRDDRSVDAATGEARKVAGEEGKLKVRFAPEWLSRLPAVWGDYWVIGLDDTYQTALVGTPDREYLWLLSRTPQRPPAEVDAWLQRAVALGFDIDRVLRTPQTAENSLAPPLPTPSSLPSMPLSPAIPAADSAGNTQ